MARRAVGDDGRTQRLIRNSHGRGYQFVGLVETRPRAELARSDIATDTHDSREAAFPEAGLVEKTGIEEAAVERAAAERMLGHPWAPSLAAADLLSRLDVLAGEAAASDANRTRALGLHAGLGATTLTHG